MRTKAKKRAARLRAEASAIRRRLDEAVVTNLDGPVLGRANIAYSTPSGPRAAPTAAWA